jgi:hypothetical protein
MHAHAYVRANRQPRRVFRRNGLLQLGWAHFWLLVAVLGGMLALIALVFFVAYFRA